MESSQPAQIIDLRDGLTGANPCDEVDPLTFQRWGANDPANSVLVVAREVYGSFANRSQRDVLELLQDLSRDSFALPENWESMGTGDRA